MTARRTVNSSAGCLIDFRRFLLLLFGQLHDEAVQIFWQALLVIVGLLGWHVDGLQGGAAIESILANLLNTSRELYSFQSNTINECFIIYQSNRPLND